MAKIRLNNILVIDLEATCWADKRPNMQHEIIEIGYCLITNLVTNPSPVLTGGSIFVKPINSDITPFCTALTGIKAEQLTDAKNLEDALKELEKMVKPLGLRNLAWASYGTYDKDQLEREAFSKGIEYPMCNRHLDVKLLASLMKKNIDMPGMPSMLEQYGLKMIGRHHSGKDDAHNIARLLMEILT